MKTNARRCTWMLAAAMTIGTGVSTVSAIAAPFQEQAPGPDYSKNKTYQQGMREGHADQAANKDHSKKRHFKKDEDQKAYEAGYQQGHQGQGH